MSTDPQARIAYWKREEGHTHGKIVAKGLTYDGALAREKKEADAKGCKQSPGGARNGLSNWSIYHVWGGK